jgi:hypothetical protein
LAAFIVYTKKEEVGKRGKGERALCKQEFRL